MGARRRQVQGAGQVHAAARAAGRDADGDDLLPALPLPVEGESKIIGFDIVAAETTRNAVPGLAWLEAGSVQLKGKSQRLPIHILVGDAALAQSPAFVELRAAHTAWLKGLVPFERCVALAAAVHPRLRRFYELVPGRAEDFGSPA